MAYDKSKYKIWTWKHPVMLHWIINPGLVINELVFGQRVPRTVLIEKDASKSLQEKTRIPCPHCGTLHPGLKWSLQNNAFKNWFGLYCDHCGKIIPCLTNLTTYLVLALTFPIWFWFRDHWKKSWLQRQAERYKNLDVDNVSGQFDGYKWIREGLYWGLFMYVVVTFLFPLVDGEGITWRSALYGLPIWTLAGLGFGYLMKRIGGRRKKKTLM